MICAGDPRHSPLTRYRRGCRCSVCRTAQSEYARKWRKGNPDKVKASRERWEAKNPEVARAIHAKAQARWRARNHERAREIRRKWGQTEAGRKYLRRYEQSEARLEYQRRWREENKAALSAYRLEYQREWRKRHPKKIAAKNHNRRARERSAKGSCSADELTARVEFYGERCYLCEGPYEQIDHVIPLARGGTNWLANLRPICKSCNSRKGAKRAA